MNRLSNAKWSSLKTYKHMKLYRLNKIYLGIYMQIQKHICMQFVKRGKQFEGEWEEVHDSVLRKKR